MTLLRDPLRAALAAILLFGSGFAGARGQSADFPAARLDRLTVETDAALAKLAQANQSLAQNYGYPPADVGTETPYRETPSQRPQQDSAGLLVRIDRLENQMRQINGQIEQLQFGARRIEEQLRKFQEDVDFRFQDGGARGAAPAAPASKPLPKRTDLGEDSVEPDAAPPVRTRRSDAFDPSKEPAAPGAPRALGTGSALTGDADAPLDLTGGRLSREASTPGASSSSTGRAAASADPIAALTAPGGPGDVTAPPNPVKAEFDAAIGFYRQKQYENAEKGFAAFLQKNAKSKMAPDAVYYLGETFFQRGRQREAAEQYLKFSTQYANAPRAPEAMLRLGQSLYSLGAKEQACATFGEINRKYPAASAAIKAGAEREAKRAQC
ncbi:tol-pal system protein YbgF [Methylocapsa palsarum]|uniref:Cell division coordinator CpoB n=1 Tax=Methylocapsa palsarum TaxID=1612308 RepID=A0A1I3VZT8_9HYPH|nr:tol-pal system protein YbgF [Methylocapsa palsarum]SFJ99867.1 tol-pal system protein YbgF [Methylocapsa palsarum]